MEKVFLVSLLPAFSAFSLSFLRRRDGRDVHCEPSCMGPAPSKSELFETVGYCSFKTVGTKELKCNHLVLFTGKSLISRAGEGDSKEKRKKR